MLQHNVANTRLVSTIGAEVQAPTPLPLVPALARPKRCKGAWCRLKPTPIWCELAAGAEPRCRPRKEGSLRKRIAKYAKPLSVPKLRA